MTKQTRNAIKWTTNADGFSQTRNAIKWTTDADGFNRRSGSVFA
jgi:hypothetical protein